MEVKVVLAYSGGLDTTAIIPWLKENYDYEVICCCIDVGQKEELDGLEERAKACGASKLYIKNVVDEYVENYIMPTVQADAVFEYKYLLGTATARPLIAKVLVDVARKEGAVAICHGATGKGNDQIRFELGIKALAPDLKIIAAWRDPKWTMDSREHLLLELFLENLIILISDHNLEHMMDLLILILHEKYAKYFYHENSYYQQRKVN